MRPFHRILRVGLSICLLSSTVFSPLAYANAQQDTNGANPTAEAAPPQDSAPSPQPDATPPSKPAPKSQGTGAPYDPIHDNVANSFKGVGTSVGGDGKTTGTDAARIVTDILKLEQRGALGWDESIPNTNGLLDLVKSGLSDSSQCKISNPDQLYIIHTTHWDDAQNDPKGKTLGPVSLKASGWYAYTYRAGKVKQLQFVHYSGTGDQSVYAKHNALIVGLASFTNLPTGVDFMSEKDQDTFFANFKDTYTATSVQGTPENLTNLATLIGAISGITVPTVSKGGEAEVQKRSYFIVSLGCQVSTPKLPYTLTITDTTNTATNDPEVTAPAAGSFTCKGKGGQNTTPCESTHTFESIDKEYLDVSVGIAAPGVRETKFTFASSAVTTGTTTHTDLYAMLDIYWAAKYFPKDYPIPHPVFGLPVTSQTFYRPLFGMSENVTSWFGIQRKFNLPVGINVFAGVVDMRTNYLVGSPATQAEFNSALKPTRAWKGAFGVEVPILSMISKLGKKSSTAPKGTAAPSS